jgi:amidase
LAAHLDQICTIVARQSPLLPDLAEIPRLHLELLAAFDAANLPADVYQHIESAAKDLPPDDDSLAAARVRGVAFSHRDWLLATRRQGRMRQQAHELFNSFDVVLCPPMPTPAFLHDHAKDKRIRHLDVDGKDVPYLLNIVWVSMATVLGLPATVAPIGHSEEGLPIGVQIVGPYLEDHTTIAFARLIEREFGGFIPLSTR